MAGLGKRPVMGQWPNLGDSVARRQETGVTGADNSQQCLASREFLKQGLAVGDPATN